MKPYKITGDPDGWGWRVILNDGTLIGYADPTDDPDLWAALDADGEFIDCEDADSEGEAAALVYQEWLKRGAK